MNGWQRYASFERKQRRERCVLCMIAGGIIAVVLFMVIPAFAHGGRTTDELYTDHKANLHQCFYADPSRAGVVACSDPAANPCTAGVFCVPEEDRCHTHSAELMLGGKTQACIDFETPPPPPPVVVPPPVVIPPATDRHSDDHPRWGVHEEDDHSCSSCDDQNGTCGWWGGHRHPTKCPNKELENVECGRASQHRHADAFENRCHSEEHQHGYVGCNWNGGPGGHKHDGLACHLATDSHEDPPPVVDKPGSGGGSGTGGGGTREVVVPPARTVVDETPVTPYDPPEEEAEVRRKAAIQRMRNRAWLNALN